MSQPTVTMCPTLANPEAFSTVPELREELHRANASILKMADQLHALSCVTQDISERLSRNWGQQLVIDNKPGANGFIAIGDAKRRGRFAEARRGGIHRHRRRHQRRYRHAGAGLVGEADTTAFRFRARGAGTGTLEFDSSRVTYLGWDLGPVIGFFPR